MSEYCVVVADAMRARLFTLEASRSAKNESGPNLVETIGMVNPEMDSRTGANRPEPRAGARAVGAALRSSDTHRVRHEFELERRFARAVSAQADALVRSSGATRLIQCASTRMLGLLRSEGEESRATVRDVPRDMTKMTPRQIHEHLAREGLLPARTQRSRAWRSFAQEARKRSGR
jgi:protein required for attachment to host cells